MQHTQQQTCGYFPASMFLCVRVAADLLNRMRSFLRFVFSGIFVFIALMLLDDKAPSFDS